MTTVIELTEKEAGFLGLCMLLAIVLLLKKDTEASVTVAHAFRVAEDGFTDEEADVLQNKIKAATEKLVTTLNTQQEIVQ